MRRRLLWNAGFALVVLAVLAGLLEGLAADRLQKALQRAQAHAPASRIFAWPPGLSPDERVCVDPLTLEGLPRLLHPIAANLSPRPPASPFEQAQIVAAAIDRVQFSLHPWFLPNRWNSPAVGAGRPRLPALATHLVIDRTTGYLWTGPLPFTAAEALALSACYLPGVHPTTLRAFLVENRASKTIGLLAGLRVPATIADIPKTSWEARAAFLDGFPGPEAVAVSRPGIGRNGTEALVYVQRTGLDGWFVLLTLDAGEWRVVVTDQIWVS